MNDLINHLRNALILTVQVVIKNVVLKKEHVSEDARIVQE